MLIKVAASVIPQRWILLVSIGFSSIIASNSAAIRTVLDHSMSLFWLASVLPPRAAADLPATGDVLPGTVSLRGRSSHATHPRPR